MKSFALLAMALVVESFFGYPQIFQTTIGHPVEWIGKLIAALDEGLNDDEAPDRDRRISGVLAVLALLVCCIVPSYFTTWALAKIPYGFILNALIATVFIAQKSLRDHVADVATSLPRSLADARLSVSKIVGRDVSSLDESGVAKAALETLAENTADGIVAPAFWYALLGLPGLVAYKAINTADSMIGHKSEKYLAFGWAAARLDDIVNLIPARLTGLLFAVAAQATSKFAAQNALLSMWRDAGKHRSPNAGWPEAAMAGALALKFGGPRNYEGELVELSTMGDGRSKMNQTDINAGLELYEHALVALLILSVILAMAL